MTPKQQVAIMVAVFSVLGVGVSVAIIAGGGGFSGSPGNIFNPPTGADIYVVGSQVTDGMTMEYSANAQGPETSIANADISINFKKSGDGWLTTFSIANGTGAQPHVTQLMLSKLLTKEGQDDKAARPFLEPVETSILAIRDFDYGGRDKYLVVGAPWSTIFYGQTQARVGVTGKEMVQTPAGTFDAFVISYKLRDNTSKIWVVKDLPLPVKAQTYDQDDKPFYNYELVKLTK